MYEITPVLDGRIKFYEFPDIKNVFHFPPLPLGDPTPKVNHSEYSPTVSASKYSTTGEEDSFKDITLDTFMNRKTVEKMEDVPAVINDSLDNLHAEERKNKNNKKADLMKKEADEEIRHIVDANEISIDKTTTGGIEDEFIDTTIFDDTEIFFNTEDEFKNRKNIDERKNIVSKNIGSTNNVFQEAKNVANSESNLLSRATTEKTLSTVGAKSELRSKLGMERTVSSVALKSDLMSKVATGIILQTTNYVDDIIDEETKTVGNEETKHAIALNNVSYINESTASHGEISAEKESNMQSKTGKGFETGKVIVAENFTVQGANHPMAENFTGVKNQDIPPRVINSTENIAEKSISNIIPESKANDKYLEIPSTNAFLKTDELDKNLTKNETSRPSSDELYSNISAEENEIRKRSVSEDVEGFVNKTNKIVYKDYLSLVKNYIKDLFTESDEFLPAWKHFQNAGQSNENSLEVNSKKETEKVPSQSK